MNRAACWWRKATLLAKVLAGGSVLFEFVNLNLVGETWFYSDKQQRIWFIHPNTLQTVQQLRGIPPMDGSGILTFLSNLNFCVFSKPQSWKGKQGALTLREYPLINQTTGFFLFHHSQCYTYKTPTSNIKYIKYILTTQNIPNTKGPYFIGNGR